MAYRFRITKENLGDLIIMLLFDKSFDDDFLNKNEIFNKFFDKLDGKGIKTLAFQRYFDVDPLIRSRYKAFRREFDKDESSVSVVMSDAVGEDYNSYKEVILESIKRITGNDSPDPEKVEDFTNEIINDILLKDEEGMVNE